ncbi:unnamed protein product, partial [Taenia asiatica]|uniref:PDEase domain-containing protein n=1 Tax=Taenia asiatica TaxID=60517 RepID=A0A0R3VYU6_TAEAS
FSDLECLSIIIACLSHDLDHRGTNNQFQIRTMSPLVNLYSTSVLEHHHFDQCIMLLSTKGVLSDFVSAPSTVVYASPRRLCLPEALDILLPWRRLQLVGDLLQQTSKCWSEVKPTSRRGGARQGEARRDETTVACSKM